MCPFYRITTINLNITRWDPPEKIFNPTSKFNLKNTLTKSCELIVISKGNMVNFSFPDQMKKKKKKKKET